MAYNREHRRQSTNVNDLFTDGQKPPAGAKIRPWLKGGCLGIIILTIIFALGIFWFVRFLLKGEDSFAAEGQHLVFEYNGQAMMAGVVSYFSAVQVTKSGGSTHRRGSTAYWIMVRRLPGGELVAKRKLEAEGLNLSNIQLLGRQDGKLWLMAGTIAAYGLPNLDPQPADIPGELKTLMPTEARYILAEPGGQVVWIDLLDGRKAWLNLQTATVSLMPDETAPPEPDASRRMAIRRRNSWSNHQYTEYLNWADTLPGKQMLMLLPDTTAARRISNEGRAGYHYRSNERVFLYQSPYSISRRGDYFEPAEDSLLSLEQEGFLQGGFLVNTDEKSTVRLGKDYLVLHRDLISDKANLLATRLSPTGTRLYTTQMMPMASCKQIISHGKLVIAIGAAIGAGPGKPGGDEAVCLNLDTGTLTRFSCWDK